MDPVTLAIIFGPAIVSAIGQIFASHKAADAQTQASQAAIAAQLGMFGITQANLQPYISGGASSMGILTGAPAHAAVTALPWKLTKNGKTVSVNPTNTAQINNLKAQGYTVTQTGHVAKAATPAKPGALSELMKPIKVDTASIEANPAYQFERSEGLKAVGNQLSSRGLDPLGSGAGVKGREKFASGLASGYYQQFFQNAMANKEMAWKALYGTTSLGESAATGLGTAASTAGADISGSIIGAGKAAATADLATADAITGFANNVQTNLLLQNARAATGTSGSLY